jgi:hypothetical protein
VAEHDPRNIAAPPVDEPTYVCRSLPQMPLRATWMTTWSADGSGIGTSSMRTSRGP